MQTSWLHNNGHEKLLVFCNGWGMDGSPFQSLSSAEYDVYMLYDYRDLSGAPDLETMAVQYRRVVLVGWSMGVWVGQKLFTDIKNVFHRTLAINGTLCPINDRWGIPVQVYEATLADFGRSSRLKFYKRMCRDKQNFSSFIARQPQRSLENQGAELAALKKMVDCRLAEESMYEEIIVADKDFIVPTANQLNYWQARQVTPVSGFHFLFNLWSSWEQLLDCSCAASGAKR